MNTLDEYIIKDKIGKTLDNTISPFIQNIIASFELPGLAIGIVINNEIVYAKGEGVTSIKTREPITDLFSTLQNRVSTVILSTIREYRKGVRPEGE